MHTGLIIVGLARGPAYRCRWCAHIDIALIAARLLGFDMPDADGVPIIGVLK